MELDTAESHLKNITSEFKRIREKVATEEDTKIQLINRILHESLGWELADIRAETMHDSGYSDYMLEINNTPTLLIEAKKIGKLPVRIAETERVKYLKISGSSLKDITSGIDQAAKYSISSGIPFSVLTDGITWVVFKTFTQGANYKSKQAIVFPSLESIANSFSLFFDLLSKTQVQKRVYNIVFDRVHNSRNILQKPLLPSIPDDDIHLIQKSELAFDLESIFTTFFSRLAGDSDKDMLTECFVETRESRIADFSLEKMTTKILGNIIPPGKDVELELSKLIETNIGIEESDYDTGQTIFIVGPTGSGKTTFLERFFNRTLPTIVKKRCIVLGINALDATGRDDTALEWLTESLIESLEKQLYDDGIPNWEQLLGLYHSEYERRAKGVDAYLYKRDKEEFKEKFSQFLADMVEKDREGYLRRILKDSVDNRKMLPIVVIDNTDEFSSDFKEKLFQFSQSIRRHAKHCMLIFPVTDKSAWAFSKTDIYGIYKSKSFFLPTPSPREVFRKRIDFLKNKIESIENTSDKKEKGDYFSSRGMRISISDIRGFAHVVESVFIDHDYTSKTIGELTNYNIRRTLLLSQRVLTSPALDIDELLKSYMKGEMTDISFTKFMDALMKGDHELYKQNDNHEIYPVFQIHGEYGHSPLLSLRILSLLDNIYSSGRNVEDKHINIESITSYFDALGCSETALDITLNSMLDASLIEPFDLSEKELSSNQKFAITHKGRVHLRLASHNSVFIYQMALTSSITNSDLASKIRSVYYANAEFIEKVKSIRALFIDYLIIEDKKYINDLPTEGQFDCQRSIIDNLKSFKDKPSYSDSDIENIHGRNYRHGLVKEGVIAVVDYYDKVKGFGFLEVEGYDSRVFIHADKLKELGLETVKDGDSILCDIARRDKGIYVSKVHDAQTTPEDAEILECIIVKLFKERGYGFVRVKDSEREAFFHISVFEQDKREEIKEGDSFIAEIGAVKKGTGYQVKEVHPSPAPEEKQQL